jgi:hypothetical protein
VRHPQKVIKTVAVPTIISINSMITLLIIAVEPNSSKIRPMIKHNLSRMEEEEEEALDWIPQTKVSLHQKKQAPQTVVVEELGATPTTTAAIMRWTAAMEAGIITRAVMGTLVASALKIIIIMVPKIMATKNQTMVSAVATEVINEMTPILIIKVEKEAPTTTTIILTCRGEVITRVIKNRCNRMVAVQATVATVVAWITAWGIITNKGKATTWGIRREIAALVAIPIARVVEILMAP